MAVGYGLLSTLTPTSSAGHWIGYQIIAGIGRGLGMTISLIAIQNNIPPAQMPVAIALLMATQTYFGALFLSFGATIFTNSLRTLLDSNVPGVNADHVAHAGAYAFRRVVSDSDLPAVLWYYAKSIDRVYYMSIGLSIICFFASFGLGWVDVRKKPSPEKKEAGSK
jgi:hypothetical protein